MGHSNNRVPADHSFLSFQVEDSGRALGRPACGPGGRGFEPRHPPELKGSSRNRVGKNDPSDAVLTALVAVDSYVRWVVKYRAHYPHAPKAAIPQTPCCVSVSRVPPQPESGGYVRRSVREGRVPAVTVKKTACGTCGRWHRSFYRRKRRRLRDLSCGDPSQEERQTPSRQ